MKKRILHIITCCWKSPLFLCSVIVLFTAEVILLWLLWALLLQPVPATEVKITPTSKEATAGAELMFHIAVNSNQRHMVHAHRDITCSDQSVYVLVPDEIKIGKGKINVYKSIIIPTEIPVGTTCALHIEAIVRVNPLREVVTYHSSGEFKIVD